MSAIAIGHVAMVMVMVMTPIHMAHVDATLTLIGLVISVHVAGMYASSPVVGSTLLVDDVGLVERLSVQGLSDLVMNGAGAVGRAVAAPWQVSRRSSWPGVGRGRGREPAAASECAGLQQREVHADEGVGPSRSGVERHDVGAMFTRCLCDKAVVYGAPGDPGSTHQVKRAQMPL